MWHWWPIGVIEVVLIVIVKKLTVDSIMFIILTGIPLATEINGTDGGSSSHINDNDRSCICDISNKVIIAYSVFQC